MKVACTVWNGGKIGDNIKDLPIVIDHGLYRQYSAEVGIVCNN